MNWKLEIKNWKLARRGFTIVELLVAMSLLVILLALSGMVFQTTVAAHRAAGATIDVTRNLRAITDQLNADFRGLQKDAPLAIWFELDSATGQRYDQIQFFADGDFQSTRQYDSVNDGDVDKTVHGNMARIYYGHAWIAETTPPQTIKENYFDVLNPNGTIDRGSLLLARRTHILTSDFNLPPFIPSGTPYPNFAGFTVGGFSALENDWYEYDQVTITDWKDLCLIVANCDHLLATCFNNNKDYTLGGRPKIDYDQYDTLHLLLSQGVIQMQVQWAYTNNNLIDSSTGLIPNPPLFAGVRWWPSVDPAGDGTIASDFSNMNSGNPFGVHFTLPGGTTNTDWFDVVSADVTKRCKTENEVETDLYFSNGFYPKALKFTFTLKDSNGLFADGKTFTHIVYIDN